MAATLNQLIYNIKEIRRKGGTTDDDDLSDRQLAFIIGYHRAKLIKEYIQKRREMSSSMVQSLPCVELIIADKAECCDIKTECVILRTKDKIPQVLDFDGKLMFKFIGTLAGVEFTYTSETQTAWLQYRRYGNKAPYAYYRNGYIYLTTDLDLELIRIDAIFEDPTAVAAITDCDSKPCFTFDSPYPLPEFMIEPLTTMILSKELRIFEAGNQDNNNDSEDEPQR